MQTSIFAVLTCVWPTKKKAWQYDCKRQYCCVFSQISCKL